MRTGLTRGMRLRFAILLTAMLLMAGAADAASKTTPPAPAPPPTKTIEELRQPVIQACSQRMPPDMAPTVGVMGACTCMIDAIIQQFGPDALSMLRILDAGLDPSQVKEIAALLGIKDDDAEKFVEMAQPRIEQIQASCAQ